MELLNDYIDEHSEKFNGVDSPDAIGIIVNTRTETSFHREANAHYSKEIESGFHFVSKDANSANQPSLIEGFIKERHAGNQKLHLALNAPLFENFENKSIAQLQNELDNALSTPLVYVIENETEFGPAAKKIVLDDLLFESPQKSNTDSFHIDKLVIVSQRLKVHAKHNLKAFFGQYKAFRNSELSNKPEISKIPLRAYDLDLFAQTEHQQLAQALDRGLLDALAADKESLEGRESLDKFQAQLENFIDRQQLGTFDFSEPNGSHSRNANVTKVSQETIKHIHNYQHEGLDNLQLDNVVPDLDSQQLKYAHGYAKEDRLNIDYIGVSQNQTIKHTTFLTSFEAKNKKTLFRETNDSNVSSQTFKKLMIEYQESDGFIADVAVSHLNSLLAECLHLIEKGDELQEYLAPTNVFQEYIDHALEAYRTELEAEKIPETANHFIHRVLDEALLEVAAPGNYATDRSRLYREESLGSTERVTNAGATKKIEFGPRPIQNPPLDFTSDRQVECVCVHFINGVFDSAINVDCLPNKGGDGAIEIIGDLFADNLFTNLIIRSYQLSQKKLGASLLEENANIEAVCGDFIDSIFAFAISENIPPRRNDDEPGIVGDQFTNNLLTDFIIKSYQSNKRDLGWADTPSYNRIDDLCGNFVAEVFDLAASGNTGPTRNAEENGGEAVGDQFAHNLLTDFIVNSYLASRSPADAAVQQNRQPIENCCSDFIEDVFSAAVNRPSVRRSGADQGIEIIGDHFANNYITDLIINSYLASKRQLCNENFLDEGTINNQCAELLAKDLDAAVEGNQLLKGKGNGALMIGDQFADNLIADLIIGSYLTDLGRLHQQGLEYISQEKVMFIGLDENSKSGFSNKAFVVTVCENFIGAIFDEALEEVQTKECGDCEGEIIGDLFVGNLLTNFIISSYLFQQSKNVTAAISKGSRPEPRDPFDALASDYVDMITKELTDPMERIIYDRKRSLGLRDNSAVETQDITGELEPEQRILLEITGNEKTGKSLLPLNAGTASPEQFEVNSEKHSEGVRIELRDFKLEANEVHENQIILVNYNSPQRIEQVSLEASGLLNNDAGLLLDTQKDLITANELGNRRSSLDFEVKQIPELAHNLHGEVGIADQRSRVPSADGQGSSPNLSTSSLSRSFVKKALKLMDSLKCEDSVIKSPEPNLRKSFTDSKRYVEAKITDTISNRQDAQIQKSIVLDLKNTPFQTNAESPIITSERIGRFDPVPLSSRENEPLITLEASHLAQSFKRSYIRNSLIAEPERRKPSFKDIVAFHKSSKSSSQVFPSLNDVTELRAQRERSFRMLGETVRSQHYELHANEYQQNNFTTDLNYTVAQNNVILVQNKEAYKFSGDDVQLTERLNGVFTKIDSSGKFQNQESSHLSRGGEDADAKVFSALMKKSRDSFGPSKRPLQSEAQNRESNPEALRGATVKASLTHNRTPDENARDTGDGVKTIKFEHDTMVMRVEEFQELEHQFSLQAMEAMNNMIGNTKSKTVSKVSSATRTSNKVVLPTYLQIQLARPSPKFLMAVVRIQRAFRRRRDLLKERSQQKVGAMLETPDASPRPSRLKPKRRFKAL